MLALHVDIHYASDMLQLAPAGGFRFVRRNERREVRRAMGLTCQVVRERDFRLVSDRALDLSPDGMLVHSEAELELGESLIVSFKATQLGLWFDSEAQVARIVKGRRDGDRGAGIGLSFSTLDRVKRLILRGHLRRVPPPLPRRTQRIDWCATVRSVTR
jgi:PilZ domain